MSKQNFKYEFEPKLKNQIVLPNIKYISKYLNNAITINFLLF
jgi:hypothetical protein